jgi:DNA-binding CsgD family transcriptional regulator
MSVADSRVSPPPTDRRSRGEVGPRLLERSQFLRELEAIFSLSLKVPSRCIAIEGPSGSGRTALVNAACGAASNAGCLVLRARGGEVEKQTPFAVLHKFVESAAAYPAGTKVTLEQAEAIEALIGNGEVARQDPNEISPLFYSLVIALRELGPVLLAVDDADLSDRATLAVLQYMVRRLENQQIWLLVSARPLHPGVGLRPVDWLLAEPETRQFMLEPLRTESVRMMLAGFFGEEPDPGFVTACCEATGGTPLFLKALLSSLGHRRVLPTADMAGRIERVPAPKITQFVLSRLALLPVAASDLLQACAILGDRADPTVARLLAKIDALAAERAADAAAQVELLRPGRPMTFSSPLIRWAIYYDIPTARRSQFHSRAAQLLAEHGAGAATVAEHLLATEPAGDVETAERLQQMGRAALGAGDAGLALRCLNRALAESSPAGRRGSLYLDLASAEMAQGRPAALPHFRRAIQLGVPDNVELIRVAIGLLRDLADTPKLRVEALRAVRGLKTLLDTVDRDLRIEFELALSMASSHPAERSQSLGRLRALLGEPGDNEHAMPQMARTFIDIQDVAAATSLSSDELAATLEKVVDVEQLLSPDPMVDKVQTMAYLGLLCTDRFATVDTLLRSAQDRARDRGHIPSELRVSFLLGISLLWQGSLTAAEEECRNGRRLGAQLDGAQQYRPTIGLVDALVRQGKIDEAREISDALPPEEIDDPIFRGLARVERGRVLVARDLQSEGLEEFLGAGQDAFASRIVNPALNSWRADAAMVLATMGEWDEAGRLAEEHHRLAREFGAICTIGVGLRAMAAATPDLRERTGWLCEAVDLLEPSPARLEAANALVELGTALVDNKKKEEARSVLRRGANLASLCGAHQLVETAGIQLRAAGARPRRLGYIGPDSLTPAELRVVRLAATGKTNQGIAADLYITVKTVEGHLAKAYRKLGVESRRNLAIALATGEESEGEDLLDSTAL